MPKKDPKTPATSAARRHLPSRRRGTRRPGPRHPPRARGHRGGRSRHLRLPLQPGDARLGTGGGGDHLRGQEGRGAHPCVKEEINALLVEKTRAGQRVVRLKGGDPFVFGARGRGGAGAGPGRRGVRGRAGSFLGHRRTGLRGHPRDPARPRLPTDDLHRSRGPRKRAGSAVDFAQVAKAPGTRVMLMGVERLESISRQLLDAGADPALPVALVRWATTPRQRTLTGTLADIAQKGRRRELRGPGRGRIRGRGPSARGTLLV